MAVKFNGSTHRLLRTIALRGIASSKKCIVSCWFQCDTDEGGDILFGGTASQTRIFLTLDPTGVVQFILKNSSNTIIYNANTVDRFDDNIWHHLIIAVDLSATTVTWRIDKEAPSLTVVIAATDDMIDFAGCTIWEIGNALNGLNEPYGGAFYDLLFKAGEYIDISDLDNLELFVSSDGRAASGDKFWQNVGPHASAKPVGYGVDAAIFNGEKPEIFFSNDFQSNKGTGGSFTVIGLPFDAATREPYIYRSSAHYDNRERWFESELTGFSYTRSKTFIEQREGHPKRGLRMGLDEMDEPFRQERPSDSYHNLLFNDREDDTEEYDR